MVSKPKAKPRPKAGSKKKRLRSVEWDGKVENALDCIGPHERALLLRLSEAKGQRVTMEELSKAMGLPPVPAIEQDFPGLHKFIEAERKAGRRLSMPVEAKGEDEKGWYWMSAEDAEHFRPVLRADVAG